MLCGVAEQGRISPLVVTSQVGCQGFQTVQNLSIHRPEFMARVTRGFCHNIERPGGADSMQSNERICQQPENPELRDRVRRPGAAPHPGEPGMRVVMSFMSGPDESQQDIDVKKMALHSSFISSRTCALVTTGKSSGTSKTGSPFNSRVPSW